MQAHEQVLEDILQTIRQMPLRERVQLVEEILSDLAQQLPVEQSAPQKYDFSDIAGRLQWQGDAVAEQRRLRDEW
jgi:hypothetical protein